MSLFTRFLYILFLAYVAVAVALPAQAQFGSGGGGDSSALETVSSEDLLQLKEELEHKKSKLEGERLQLLDKGLRQSKEYLEKHDRSSATTALVLLQRAEYLFSVLEDQHVLKLDSVYQENVRRLKKNDEEKETYRYKLAGAGKNEKEIEDAVNQLSPPVLLEDPEMDYADMARTYQQLIDNFPESPYVVDAMYNIAYIREQEGKQLKTRALNEDDDNKKRVWENEGNKKQREALKYFEDLARRFPDSKYAAESYNRIGAYYFAKGGDDDLNKAIKNYSKVLDYPQSARFQEAVYQLAWTHYRLSNYPQAISYFTYLVDDVDSAKRYNLAPQELDVEAITYIGISFNRWAEQIDMAMGTNDGGYRLIQKYIDEAKLKEKRYAPEIIWALGESYYLEQKDTLATFAYNQMILSYPMNWRAPYAQKRVIDIYERLLNGVTDQGKKKSLRDSMIVHRFKLYEAYKPNSEWSLVQTDQEQIRYGNKLARDVLVDNILYYYDEAQITMDKENWRIAMIYSKQFISYFPVDTFAYKFHYNLALIQYNFFGLLDSAYENYIKVATTYPFDTYRYQSAINAYIIADSLYKKAPFKKPSDIPSDSVLPLMPSEEKLIDAIDNYARLFPDTVQMYPVDSLENPEPKMGKPGKRTPDFLAQAGAIYYDHNNFRRSSQYFNTIVNRYPFSDKVNVSERYLMQTYYDRKDFRSSEIVARRIYENPTSTNEQKANAVQVIFVSIFRHADDFRARKEPAKAAREYQRAFAEGRRLNYAKQEDVATSLYNAADEYVKSKELKRAVTNYAAFADTFPNNKYAPNALYNVQYLMAEMKEFESASKVSERIVDRYPNFSEDEGKINAMIVMYNAEYYMEQAANRAELVDDSVGAKRLNYEAIRLSEKFVRLYPKSEYTQEMDYGIAKLLFKVNEEEQAYKKYEAFARTYPNDKRNVESFYRIGINHLSRNRRVEAITAFNEAKRKSDDLKRQKLDYNRFFSSEALYELGKLKYEEFTKLDLKMPNVEQKEDKKLGLVKELIELYERITEMAQIRTYEAAYYRGFVREQFGDALQNKEFKFDKKNLAKQVLAQKDVYKGASNAYRGAVSEYKNSYDFLEKAMVRLADEEKAIADSIYKRIKNKDSAAVIIGKIIDGRTAKEKEFSLKRQKELALYFRDLSKSRISRIIYSMANSNKLILETYLNAPIIAEHGSIDYVAEKQGILSQLVAPASKEAIAGFKLALREADSLGISDKYSNECRRNIVKISGIVPSELAGLSFTVMEKYNSLSDYYRMVTSKGQNFVDPKTKKGFWDIFYDLPAQINVFVTQYAPNFSAQAVKLYTQAITEAKDNNMFDEDARQILREELVFAYDFASMNYQAADTADYYNKKYQEIFFANEDKDDFAHYSDAMDTYGQIIGFCRENARTVLTEAFNACVDLGLVTLVQDPNGAEGENIAKTDDVFAKRILALLGKYDEYYAKLLKLKTTTYSYASNYDDWLSSNVYDGIWQTGNFNDRSWYPAAPPPASAIVRHEILDLNKSYPLWLGIGQTYQIPTLPEVVKKKEIIIDKTGIGERIDSAGTPADTAGTGTNGETKTDTAATIKKKSDLEDKVESFYYKGMTISDFQVLQDTFQRRILTQEQIKRQLDTTNIVYFRFKFNIPGVPQSGKVYIACDGYYEFYMNGVFLNTAMAEPEDTKGDSLEITDLFSEHLVQGKNVFAILVRDNASRKEHHGIRIFIQATEVEDATAEFAEPAMPDRKTLQKALVRRGRVMTTR